MTQIPLFGAKIRIFLKNNAIALFFYAAGKQKRLFFNLVEKAITSIVCALRGKENSKNNKDSKNNIFFIFSVFTILLCAKRKGNKL